MGSAMGRRISPLSRSLSLSKGVETGAKFSQLVRNFYCKAVNQNGFRPAPDTEVRRALHETNSLNVGMGGQHVFQPGG